MDNCTLQLLLGLHLDGDCWRPPVSSGSEAGHRAVGPLGFLDAMELRLGLPPAFGGKAVRVAQYEAAIRSCWSDEFFFARSFSEDAFGTSGRLLQIREELLLSGYRKLDWSQAGALSDRLRDFARIEKATESFPVHRGIPERIDAILNCLEAEIPLADITLTLANEARCWPQRWQALFHTCREKGMVFAEAKPILPRAPAQSDLGRMQRALLDGGTKAKPRGDGSLLCLDAGSLEEAALWAAAREAVSPELILQEQDSLELDEAFGRSGSKRPGYRVSADAPVLTQILPIRIALCWQPAEASLWREFLLLPLNLTPRKLRGRLLKLLSEQPAPFGNSWREAVSAWEGELEPDRKPVAANRAALWLREPEHEGGSLLPKETVRELANDFIAWLGPQLSEWNSAQAAASQAGLLLDILKWLPRDSLGREEWMRILSQIHLERPVQESFPREKDGPFKVGNCDAIQGECRSFLWWNAVQPDKLQARLFWNRQEQASLEMLRVDFQHRDFQIQEELRGWIAAIASAREQVVLIIPQAVDGEALEPHPIFHLMEKASDEKHFPKCRQSLSTWLKSQKKPKRKTKPLLLKFKNEWQIDRPLVQKGAWSASGLELLLGCPLAYVMEKQAKIGDGERYVLGQESQVRGNLAHRIIQTAFEKGIHEQKGADKAERAFQALIHSVLKEEASGYLAPTKRLELADLEQILHRAWTTLAEILRQGKWRVVGSETHLEAGEKSIGKLHGYLDLQLQRIGTPDQKALIDLKWGGYTHYRDKLKLGKSLQLAHYSRILGGSSFPPTGYFIISKASLLTVHGQTVFSGAEQVDGPNEKVTWKAFLPAAKRRMTQLSQGTVELGDPEAPTDSMALPAPCRFCNFGDICHIEHRSSDVE